MWRARIVLLLTALLAAACVLLRPMSACSESVRTSARATIVIDAISGRALLEANADEPLPMASTTKVMTALLAIEKGCMTDPVTCSRNAFGVPGTSIYLSEGETLTLEQMLYGLMISSGNDAAVAIAEHIGGSVSEFCRMMTDRATALGCTDTVFLTPHGLPMQGHTTTARDLAKIARAAMQYPLFRQIVSTTRATIPWEGRSYDRVLNNKNRLLRTYQGATGIKTGYTRAAGRCLVFGARRDGMELIGVVLNCADWFDEAERLLDLAFERYHACTMLCRGDSIRALPVDGSDVSLVPCVLASDLSAVIGQNDSPALSIELPPSLTAPVHAGDVVGKASLVCGDVTLCVADIIAADDAPLRNLQTQFHKYLRNWLILPVSEY